jgi:hypothetical protein
MRERLYAWLTSFFVGVAFVRGGPSFDISTLFTFRVIVLPQHPPAPVDFEPRSRGVPSVEMTVSLGHATL